MQYFINCDASCEPFHPGGLIAWAFIVKLKGTIIHQDCHTCGRDLSPSERTGNVGEYYAVMAAVRWLLSLPPEKQFPAMIRSDSDLIVKQLEGTWRCKDKKLSMLHSLILKAKQRYPRVIKFHWIPREKNAEVDALSRTAYDEDELQHFRDNKLDILFEGDDLSF